MTYRDALAAAASRVQACLATELDGYADLDITVAVSAGQEFVLTSGTNLAQLGMLIVESEPAGATIWLDGVNTGEVTPNNFALGDDNYTITLQLTDYADTTVITQIADAGTATVSINLRPEFTTSFSTTIWETIGTTAQQPSGLDLSTGNASSIGEGSNSDVDVFYESNGFPTAPYKLVENKSETFKNSNFLPFVQ